MNMKSIANKAGAPAMIKNMKLKLLAGITAGLLVSAVAAQAQVGVTATLPGATTTSAAAPTLATSGNFDMNGGNAVALLVTTEASSGSATNMFASFAGQPMTLGAGTNYSAQGAFIFYLINPPITSGSFEITSSNSSGGFAYSAIALGNVAGVAGADAVASGSSANTTPLDVSYTTATNGGFVLGAAVNNDYNGGRPISVAYGNPNTQLLSFVDVGSSGHFHTYGVVPMAGTNTDGYYGQYQRTAIATLAFETAELLTPISWAVGDDVWDINSSLNWSDGMNLVPYKEISGVGSDVIFDDSASGTSPITVTLDTSVKPGSVIVSNSVKDYIISGSGGIAGGAELTKTGSGTLTLGTANTFAGGVNLNGGTTVFSSLNNLGAGTAINFDGGTLKYNGNSDDISARTVTFNAGGATIDDGGNTIYFSNPVGNDGAGGFTKAGSGTVVLGDGFDVQSFNYHGNTVVANGTLAMNAYATLPNSPAIIINAGATFDTLTYYSAWNPDGKILAGDGTFYGPVNSSSCVITPGTNGVAGTLTFGNDLAISGGSLDMDISADPGQSDLLIVSGTLNISGGTVQLNVTSTLTNGTYKLIQYGSLSGSSGSFTLTGFSQSGQSATLDDTTPGEIDLVVSDTASDNIVWTGTAGATWDLVNSLNWNNGVTSWAYTNGDTVTFDQTGFSYPNVSLQAAVSPGSVVVSNDVSTTYSFQDGTGLGGGKIHGTASIVKKGDGTLNIETFNNNTGGITIEAGTVNVTGSLGSGSVTNNGQLILSQSTSNTIASLTGSGSVTRNGSGTVTVSGAADYTGPTTVSSGTLQIGSGGPEGVLSTSAITNNGELILNSSTDWTFSIPDTGAGILTKEGTNTLTLNGANARTGDTAVYHGRLVLGNVNQLKGSASVESSTILDMNGYDQLLLNLNGNGGGKLVNDAGTATNILTVSNSVAGTADVDIYDNEGSGGAIALVKQGTGMLSVYGHNYYSGGTTLQQGTVRVWASTPFGLGPLFMAGGALDFYGNNAYVTNSTYLLAPTNIVYPDGNNYWPAPLIGTNVLLVDFSVGGNNDTLTINGGAAKWAGVTNTCYLQGSGGYFRFNSGSDASGVTFDLNDSAVTISSSGAQDIHLGALIGNVSTAILWPAGGSSFIIGAKNLSTAFAGQLGGGSGSSTSLIKVGTGTLTLTGTNLFTAALTVSNGILALAQDAAPSSMSPIRVVSGATLDVTGLALSTLSLGVTNVAQTLSGSGMVNGSVLIGTNAVVSPGSSIGTLTINNALTLNGTAIMELNRTNSQTADRINAGSFSGTGMVNVTNVGPDLVTGDTFQLFNSAVPGVTVNLPASNVLSTVQYIWTNKVATDGSIKLLSGASAVNTNPPPILSSYSGGVLTLSWPTNAGWTLQMQTNSLSTGLSTNWVDVPGSTGITLTNITVDPSKPTVFYRLALPPAP